MHISVLFSARLEKSADASTQKMGLHSPPFRKDPEELGNNEANSGSNNGTATE